MRETFDFVQAAAKEDTDKLVDLCREFSDRVGALEDATLPPEVLAAESSLSVIARHAASLMQGVLAQAQRRFLTEEEQRQFIHGLGAGFGMNLAPSSPAMINAVMAEFADGFNEGAEAAREVDEALDQAGRQDA